MRVYKIESDGVETIHLSDLKEIAYLLTEIVAPVTISPLDMTHFEYKIIDEQENKRINNGSTQFNQE